MTGLDAEHGEELHLLAGDPLASLGAPALKLLRDVQPGGFVGSAAVVGVNLRENDGVAALRGQDRAWPAGKRSVQGSDLQFLLRSSAFHVAESCPRAREWRHVSRKARREPTALRQGPESCSDAQMRQCGGSSTRSVQDRCLLRLRGTCEGSVPRPTHVADGFGGSEAQEGAPLRPT